MAIESLRIIDTHTGGEPTRVVIDAALPVPPGALPERVLAFGQQGDGYRRAVVCEPRGSDVMVGAWLLPPSRPECVAGVIFFNNVGVLGMCGHGTMGVAVALQYLNRIQPGKHRLETIAGEVEFELGVNHQVAVHNVPSYRFRERVPVALPDGRTVHGDLAWGGNWFFICNDHGLEVRLSNLPRLQDRAVAIRRALDTQPIRGAGGGLIDHVELIGPPDDVRRADAKNFVLCPGAAYDRSPCGTGTSAKMACLAASGSLQPGQLFRQESIVGSVFEASFEWAPKTPENGTGTPWILPSIRGAAWVNGDGRVILDDSDPFCWGIQ